MAIPDALKSEVRSAWPESRPEYWTSADEFKWHFMQRMNKAGVDYYQGGLVASGGGMGLSRFDGIGTDRANGGSRPYHWYPPRGIEQTRWDEPNQRWVPPEFQLHLVVEKSEELGFWYCTRMGERPKSWLTALNAVKIRLFIDGMEVSNPSQQIFRGTTQTSFVFHRDEFLFQSGVIDVGPSGEQIDD